MTRSRPYGPGSVGPSKIAQGTRPGGRTSRRVTRSRAWQFTAPATKRTQENRLAALFGSRRPTLLAFDRSRTAPQPSHPTAGFTLGWTFLRWIRSREVLQRSAQKRRSPRRERQMVLNFPGTEFLMKWISAMVRVRWMNLAARIYASRALRTLGLQPCYAPAPATGYVLTCCPGQAPSHRQTLRRHSGRVPVRPPAQSSACAAADLLQAGDRP